MKTKHTKKKWNSLPIYALRTLAIVDNMGYIIENGEIVGTENRGQRFKEYVDRKSVV